MNHEVDVSNLMFNKTAEKSNFKKYDINVDLEEESSDDQKTILKYSLDLTSNPKNSVINISGNTVLSGEKSEVEDFLKQENGNTPEVVSLIYQELFPLMYIISKNMKIPSPSHTLSQNNVTKNEEQISSAETSEEQVIESESSINEEEVIKEDDGTKENQSQSETSIDNNETNQNSEINEEASQTGNDIKSNVNEDQSNDTET